MERTPGASSPSACSSFLQSIGVQLFQAVFHQVQFPYLQRMDLHVVSSFLNCQNLMVNACFVSLNTAVLAPLVILARKCLLACWKMCQIPYLNWVACWVSFQITQTNSSKSHINPPFPCNFRASSFKCPDQQSSQHFP